MSSREVSSRSGRSFRIELPHFEGCPGFTETLSVLERIASEEGLVAEIVPVTLGTDNRYGFPGSPIVLVDGEDLFPAKRCDACTMSCRIYSTPEGPKNHPTVALVRQALAKRSSREQLAPTKSR